MDGTSFRRRRLSLVILVAVVLTVVCGARWQLPSYLKDVDGLNWANIVPSPIYWMPVIAAIPEIT
jgi:hypothetical protein